MAAAAEAEDEEAAEFGADDESKLRAASRAIHAQGISVRVAAQRFGVCQADLRFFFDQMAGELFGNSDNDDDSDDDLSGDDDYNY